jgi:hypothetical protein
MPFYGWTWVADEPWGAAPFHYGRWVVVGGRWGWIPGPREGHPVWSPAQVVFAGGIQVGGVGVSVWFPLGPGEAYRPWYPCTPQYINQINITNIHESNIIHVQTTYVNIVNVTNVTYVNRTVGVTAMSQNDFAAGHSTRTALVKVDPQQLAHVQPLARPAAPAPAQRQILHPVAKPASAPQARPVLINSKGQQAAAAPNAKPVPVPVKATPAPKPIPGRAPIGTPTLGGKPVAPAAKTAAEPAKPEPAAKTEEPAKQQPNKPAAPAVKPATQPTKATPAPADKPAPAAADAKSAKPGDQKPTAKDAKKPNAKPKAEKKEEDKKPE